MKSGKIDEAAINATGIPTKASKRHPGSVLDCAGGQLEGQC